MLENMARQGSLLTFLSPVSLPGTSRNASTNATDVDSEQDTDSDSGSERETIDDTSEIVPFSSQESVVTPASSEVRPNPRQPKLSSFPPSQFGKQTRSFQSAWFKRWKWLDWDDDMNGVFCHSCRNAALLHFKLSKRAESTFSTTAFRNWKDATRSFRKHESSTAHKEAALKWVHYSKSQSVAAQISKQLLRDQVLAQKCLLKIISSLRYLARQGLAVRGHSENDGNLMQLLQLRGEDSDDLISWLDRRENWLSHDIQNELLEIMSRIVLKSILAEVKQNKYFTIIVDEATDVSFREQVSICLRHVSSNTLEIQEEFTGLYETENTTAETLTILIKDAMCRYGLSLSDCRGQAYDGAANLSGRLSGVQARISREYPKALYIHCFCHSLNLAIQDSSRKIDIICHTLDTVLELSNLIRYSAKRKALLERIRRDFEMQGSSLRPLCPTRWTVKHKSLDSLHRNYAPLLEALQEIAGNGTSSFEVRSKAGGILRSLLSFKTFFGVKLGVKFYGITDALSSTLQGRSVTAFDGKNAAKSVCQSLMGLRSEASFTSFWDDSCKQAQELQLEEPSVPRVRRPPLRLDGGSNPTSFSSPSDYYRKVYFEFIDCIHGEIVRRFEQENYHLYMKAERLLLQSASTGEILSEYFDEVCHHYREDLEPVRLRNQLSVVKDIVSSVSPSLCDIQTAILSLNTTSCLFSEIIKLLQLLYTVPTSTASAERSFSSLRRLKTYLRSTMTPQRLNHMLLLHVHKSLTDNIDLRTVAKDFVTRNERRKNFFGTF